MFLIAITDNGEQQVFCNTAYVSFDGRNQQELRVGDKSVLLFRKRHSFFSFSFIDSKYSFTIFIHFFLN